MSTQNNKGKFPRATMTVFARAVIDAVRGIPRGATLTYKEVARKARHPKAYRAVGTILNRYNYKITGIPCHRVVRSDGKPGGYIDGVKAKKMRLASERLRRRPQI